jgi:hypothetical protein
VLGSAEELEHRSLFDDAARVHHDHARRELGHDAEVVRDEHHAHLQFVLELAQQVEDLRLHRDVERGRRLVGDEQLGLAGERHCDHDPLAHAARELMRVRIDARLRSGDADELQHLDRLVARLPARRFLVQLDDFGDLASHRVDGVERGHRLLEDHRDLPTAKGTHRWLGKFEQILPCEKDPAAVDRARRWNEPHDRERGDGLAGTGFADDRDGASFGDVERDAVDGSDPTAFGRKRRGQVLDREQGRQSPLADKLAHGASGDRHRASGRAHPRFPSRTWLRRAFASSP